MLPYLIGTAFLLSMALFIAADPARCWLGRLGCLGMIGFGLLFLYAVGHITR